MYTQWTYIALLLVINHAAFGMDETKIKSMETSTSASPSISDKRQEERPSSSSNGDMMVNININIPNRMPESGMRAVRGKVPSEIKEIIDIFRNRHKYDHMGADVPSGLLMVGLPGVGKSHIARKIAEELDFELVEANAAQFAGPHPGDDQKRIEELFCKAHVSSIVKKGSILFIDEFDAIGSRENISSANIWYKQAIITLLTLMDKKNRFPIIAATNKADDIDPAFKRPGRLDRIIEIPLPDCEDRLGIFQFYAERTRYDKLDINFEELARLTDGCTPADIKFLVNEAALCAVREDARCITMKHYRVIIDNFAQRKKRVLMNALRIIGRL